MAELTVANEIVRQMGGIRRLTLMVGAGNFAGDEDSVQFSFKGYRKANKCRIVLEPSDTYRVEFWKVRSRPTYHDPIVWDMVAEFNDVYNDMLVSIFESETGLYLTL